MSETFVVKTNYGPVRGVKRTSHVGDEFVSFRGIPYAQPPLGALRFKVSVKRRFDFTCGWFDADVMRHLSAANRNDTVTKLSLRYRVNTSTAGGAIVLTVLICTIHDGVLCLF